MLVFGLGKVDLSKLFSNRDIHPLDMRLTMLRVIQTYNKDPNKQPSEQELRQYQQIAYQELQRDLAAERFTKQIQLHIHSDVLSEVIKENGLFKQITSSLNHAEGQKNIQALQQRVHYTQRQLNRYILDQSLLESALISSHDINEIAGIIEQKRALSWMNIPSYDKQLASRHIPSEKSIQEAYNDLKPSEPSYMTINYIHLPSHYKKISTIQDDLLLQPNNLNYISKKYGVKIQTSKKFSLESGHNSDITKHNTLRKHAFEKISKTSMLSNPITLPDHSTVIIQKKSYHASKTIPLASIKKSIIQRLQTQYAITKRHQAISQQQKKLTLGKTTIQDLAKTFKTSVHTTGLLSPTHDQKNHNIPKVILRHGFSQPSDKIGWQNSMLLPSDNDQWHIYAITNRQVANESQISKSGKTSANHFLHQVEQWNLY
ncbi:MAG: hypothetical protein VYC40_00475 [Pseudomonadota bacterium]|nr:hypothetical protein [Pseudomonadota bacterium]